MSEYSKYNIAEIIALHYRVINHTYILYTILLYEP